MLLCWNRGKYSPIHDHPSDGCWVKVIQGTINEVRYNYTQQSNSSSSSSSSNNQNNSSAALVETTNTVLTSGVSYMDDSLGLHKVGNPSADVDAITLHLYAPPYEKCRVWFDPSDATKSSVAVSTFYTEFGEKIEY